MLGLSRRFLESYNRLEPRAEVVELVDTPS